MPILTRNDGTQFAVYTYRETLNTKSTAVLKREAMMLARDNGQYARLFVTETGEVEAVFSRDSGYLLAETIWQHFDNPSDMIYCEALQDTQNALLVVIRGGSVYLDAELPVVNLADEFISLAVGDNRYAIYVHGDIPLAAVASAEKFAFDELMVESFTELTDPVFPALALDANFELIPIDDALAEIQLPSTGLTRNLIILALITVIAYIGWKVLAPAPQPVTVIDTPPPVVTAVTPQNPYADYQIALTTPAPSAMLMEMVDNIQLLLTIPGWTATAMNFADQQLSFDLGQDGGNAGLLIAWVKNHQVDFQAQNGRASLFFPVRAPNRNAPNTIYNLRETIAQLYDDLNRIFPDTTISIGAVEEKTNYKQASIDIGFSNISLGLLVLLARELQSFPVNLVNCTLNIDSGVLSGSLQLQVLGA